MASAVPRPSPPPPPPAAPPPLAPTSASEVALAPAPAPAPIAAMPAPGPVSGAPAHAPTSGAPGPSPTSDAAAPQPNLRPALPANNFRLVAVVERFTGHFKGSIRCLPPELSTLSFALAKSIDYALTINDVPAIVDRLPSIIKQVYHQHRNDSSLQSSIMVMLIAAKNACKNGWFHGTDANELLTMANELSSSFCMTVSTTTEAANVLDIISKIVPRYYPCLKLCRLLVSFEARPGYDILMSDFHIARNKSPEERIRLFVSQKEDVETSSCIITPPQVSFLVNGKGVDRRTNASLDNGPQYPTDITKMLKYGTNIIQAMGHFSRNYIIAVAYMTDVALSAPELKDYVQPTLGSLTSDSDITEGPSRISLNCPISFRRIKTPVKGHNCRHHQCFDYENFMEMNSRKPSWRCPCCNQPVSFIDLRIDQNMSKILGEVGQGVADVVISSDGSWKVFFEHNRNTDHMHIETHEDQQGCSLESEASRILNMLPDVVDLTMEDGDYDSNCYETEDVKPFKDIQLFPNSEVPAGPPDANCTSLNAISASQEMGVDVWSRVLSSAAPNGSFISVPTSASCMAGTLESLFPRGVIDPVITDAVTPALNRESSSSTRVSQPSLSLQHVPVPQVGQYSESMQLQQSRIGYSIVSPGSERQVIPRHVNRVPTAVQALPVQSQATGLSQRPWTTVIGANSLGSSGSSSALYQTFPLATIISDGWNAENGNIELQQLPRTSGIGSSFMQPRSMTQGQDHQDRRHIKSSPVQQVVGLAASNPVPINTDQDRRHIKSPSVQQIVGLAAPNPVPISTRPPVQQRGIGAYKSPLQPPSDLQSPLNSRVHHSANLPATIPPKSSPHFSTPIRQPTQKVNGTTSADSSNLQIQLPAPWTAVRLHSRDTIQPQMKSATTSTPEMPSEHNWRPTGRMRGSLTGSAYSAALNQYLSPARPAARRPPISHTDQVSVLVSNSIKSHRPVSQQANLGPGDTSNQPGGSGT